MNSDHELAPNELAPKDEVWCVREMFRAQGCPTREVLHAALDQDPDFDNGDGIPLACGGAIIGGHNRAVPTCPDCLAGRVTTGWELLRSNAS